MTLLIKDEVKTDYNKWADNTDPNIIGDRLPTQNEVAQIPAPVVNPLQDQLNKDAVYKERSVIGDAFDLNNPVAATIKAMRDNEFYQPEKGYDPVQQDSDLFVGYGEHFDELRKSQSHQELVHRIKTIDDERKAREFVSESGTTGVIASLAAGILDPINFVPILGQTTKAKALYAAGTVAADEALMHGLQHERTMEETALNVGTAGLMTGALVHVASKYGGTEAFTKFNREMPHVSEDVGTVSLEEIKASAQHTTTPEFKYQPPEDVKGLSADASGVDTRYDNYANEPIYDDNNTKLSGKNSILAWLTEKLSYGPSARLLASDESESRRLALELSRTGLTVNGHTKGMAWNSAEDMINADMNRLAGTTVQTIEKEFKNFLKEKGVDENILYKATHIDQYNALKSEFMGQVNHASRFDTTLPADSAIMKAANAVRNVYKELGDRSETAGLLQRSDLVHGADYYAPRLFDKNKVMANSIEFSDFLKTEFTKQIHPEILKDFDTTRVAELKKLYKSKGRGKGKATKDQLAIELQKVIDQERIDTIKQAEGEAMQISQGIVNKIIEGDNEFAVTGARKVTLADDVLAPWLVNDPVRLMMAYSRKQLPKIVLNEKFGGHDFEHITQYVTEAYRKRRFQEGDAVANKAYNRDIAALKTVYDNLMGNGGPARDGLNEIINSTLKISAMQNLGGVVLTSLTDAGRQITINGLGKTLQYETKYFVTNNGINKMAKDEVRSIVAPLENLSNGRFSQLADVMDEYEGANKIHGLVNWMHSKFMKATLLPEWTANQKTISGLIAQNKIITAGKRVLNGEQLTPSETTYLSKVGLDTPTLKKIAEQYNTHGDVDLLNLDKWDKTTGDAMRSSMNNITNNTIITIGAGDLHGWQTNNMTAKFFMQFTSYMFAAWNKTVVAGLQGADANFYMACAAQLGIGAAIVQAKHQLSGKPLPDKIMGTDGLIASAVDASGLSLMPFEIYNRGSSLLGLPTMGKQYDYFTNEDTHINNTKSGNPDWTRALGTTAQLWGRLAKATEALGPSEMKQRNIEAFRKALPFNNIFYASPIFDRVEQYSAKKLGVDYEPKDTIFN